MVPVMQQHVCTTSPCMHEQELLILSVTSSLSFGFTWNPPACAWWVFCHGEQFRHKYSTLHSPTALCSDLVLGDSWGNHRLSPWQAGTHAGQSTALGNTCPGLLWAALCPSQGAPQSWAPCTACPHWTPPASSDTKPAVGKVTGSWVTDDSHTRPVLWPKQSTLFSIAVSHGKHLCFFSVSSEEGKAGVRACNRVLLIRTDGAGLLLQNIYSSYTLSNSASCFEINKLLLQNCTVKAEVCPLPAQAVVTGLTKGCFLGELMD